MTALGGFWSYSGQAAERKCERMLAAQAAYGTRTAWWSGGAIALGRRLFNSLPEDRYDLGPAVGGGGLVVTADIRLDNRADLIRALGIEPEGARSLSDASLLLRCLERWQEEAVERLVGDFAFALWDARRERLVLARDFIGQRPLHFHQGEGFFAFASMPKGLHALPEVPYAPDRAGVAEFLALLPETGTRTFFEHVERVRPGHIAIVTRDGIQSRPYWRPSLRPLKLRSGEYEEALREKLDEAVGARLRGAETRIAAHLSAGLDSSAVAATAARLLAPAGGEVFAFTAVPRPGFAGAVPRGRFADEGPLAAQTAALHGNIRHILIDTRDRSPLDGLDRSFFLYERPVLNLCNGTWTHAINDAVRERKLTVLLSGQMGNMTLSYAGLELLPQLLMRGRLLRLAGEIGALVRSGFSARKLAWLIAGPFVPLPLWGRLARIRRGGLELRKYSAIGPAAAERYEIGRKAAERRFDFSSRPWRSGTAMRLWTLNRVDPGLYRKGSLAGWGIDYRDPTADRRLVEFCLSVPEEQFLRGGVPRSLAVRALADRLPEAVLAERRKGYQGADWYEGLSSARETLRGELERIASTPAGAEALDTEHLQNLLQEWPVGGWEQRAVVNRYRAGLLRGVSAGHFLRKAGGANA